MKGKPNLMSRLSRARPGRVGVRRGLVSLAVAAMLATVAACGGGDDEGGASPAPRPEVTGPPQRGGSAVIIQQVEPRSLDPATMVNVGPSTALLGNALYGTLLHFDAASGELVFDMAESLQTEDGGTTWTLTLRPDLKFSDGSPLDAEAVRFNWERAKDPFLAGANFLAARHIATIEVVDPRTIRFTLSQAMPSFVDSIARSCLNWMASPAALDKGEAEFDKDPVGAGPFTLVSWTRNDRIELERNPEYYDPERPYLDALTIRSNNDINQRVNSLKAGEADVILLANQDAAAKLVEAGFPESHHKLNGANAIFLNGGTAPFDDPRAREAFVRAVDVELVNKVAYDGHGTIATTLFQPDDPLYSDVTLGGHDPERAQQLFDELAAEGKPVEFTMVSFPSIEIRSTLEAIQAQLESFENVKVEIEVLDFAGATSRMAQRQFQAIMGGILFEDPELTVADMIGTGGLQNYAAISDPAIDEALAAARTAAADGDVEARRAAYRTVQERMAELNPFLLLTRSDPGVVTARDIYGVEFYGVASLLPDRLWRATSTDAEPAAAG